jgi:pyrroloquinoline quinone biosynthesis protein B
VFHLFFSSRTLSSIFITVCFIGYSQIPKPTTQPTLKILGTVQDGGSPHIGCTKKCCANLSQEQKEKLSVTALSIHQPQIESTLLFEATPDIISQWSELETAPSGIFLTHAHIGHYSGLMQLGREALGSKNIPVYAMPKMAAFLKNNAPWSQLTALENIAIVPLKSGEFQKIGQLKIRSIQVPHRDEFSETVAFFIEGPQKKVLFLPDIDKWNRWEVDLETLLKSVDYAFIDATFFDLSEVNYRPIEEIPHPLVKETISLLEAASEELKAKIYFIHMNHTNPMLDPNSQESKWVVEQGFKIARKGQTFSL